MEKVINLWGLRTRFSGSWKWEENMYIKLCGYMQEGLAFHIGILSVLSSTLQLKFGYISFPNGDMKAIDNCSIGLNTINLEDDLPPEMTINIYVGGKEFRVKMKVSSDGWKLNVGSRSETCVQGRLVTYTLNDELGRGFCEFNYKSSENKAGSDMSLYDTRCYLKEPDFPRNTFIPSVLALTDTVCQCSWVAGGKGASLALMKSLEKKMTGFTVPKGVVVSGAAYQQHMKTHPGLLSLVRKLEQMYGSSNLEAVRRMCESVMNGFQQFPLTDNLKQSLRQRLQEVFGDSLTHVRFAVRSSGVGEDSSEASAAGQMESILGVTTLDKMYEAIKNCWASQFSLTSVQYNRQNGQALNNGMAIVIQEMVPAEIAGVAFTCDPASGDPRFITISANYGLGESVVSASCDPDSVILRKLPSHAVQIQSITVGAKKTKVSMNETGTIVEDVPQQHSGKCCITEAQAMHLGRTALTVEDAYGDPRDIEWAFVGDHLFLLQARPITTWDLETEYELIHEFDTGMLTNSEYMSRANVGEVFPGALTPLTITSVSSILAQGNQTTAYEMGGRFRRNVYGTLAISQWQIQFLLISVLFHTSKPDSELSLVDRCWELSFFGRIIDEGSAIRQRCRQRFQAKLFAKLQGFLVGLRATLKKDKDLKNAQRRYQNFRIPIEKYDCAADLYQSITENFIELCQAVSAHYSVSMSSGFMNSIVLSTLLGQQKEVPDDLFEDLCTLLSNCKDVESAGVPQAIEDLAETIRDQTEKGFFLGMSVEEALEWLQNDRGCAGDKFRNFILQHGHRCLKEFELMSRTWDMDPTALVKSLQVILRAPPSKQGMKRKTSERDVIEELKTPLIWISKKVLKHAAKWSRKCVAQREKSKSILVRALHQLRKAYIHLASLMVKEGRLPDAMLIYFLTHGEIGKLLSTRSARLLSKAARRRRLYSTLDNFRYPEISCGIPRPVNLESNLATEDIGIILRGTPVCYGRVKGTARVVLNLEEADIIQANDILVTYSTDIGWSPYFPLLGGIVTELGGLISHGAVVAREYGIPCVVGLHGATMMFKSGDQVVLNGYEGFLQKVKRES